jgi:hypothetical protein
MQRAASSVLLGGVALGTLDGTFASTWWAIAVGASPVRIFQGVAAGLLGKASYDGGLATAALGLGLHYVIATTMVLAYVLVSRKVDVLVRHPLAFGPLYGLVLYACMEYVVLPLSARGPSKFDLAWVVASVVMHMIFGTICALSARRAWTRG